MADKPTWIPVQVASLVYLALFLNFFLVGSIVPLIPRIVEALGMKASDTSVILSTKSFVHMAVSPLIALLSSRIHPEIVFCFGVFCICGAFVGVALSSGLAGFVVARAVQGVGIASVMVSGMSILIKCTPPAKRGKYTSAAYSALGHSTLVSPLLSGVMYDYLGQMWTFLIPAIMTFVSGLLAAVVFIRIQRHVEGTGENVAMQRLSLWDIWLSLKGILAYPLTPVALIGIFSTGVSFGCFEVTVPALLANTELSVIMTNLLWSIGPLCFTIVVPIIGFMVDKRGPTRFFILGLFLFAVFYPLFHLVADSLWGLGLIIGLIFTMDAFLEVTVYPIIALIVDARNANSILPFAYSMNEVCIQAGFAVGDLVGVPISEWGGLKAIGIIMGGWDGLFGIISIFLWRYSLRLPVVEVPGTAADSDIRNEPDIMPQASQVEKVRPAETTSESIKQTT